MVNYIIGKNTMNITINKDGKLKNFVLSKSDLLTPKVIDLCRKAKDSGDTTKLEEILQPGYKIPHLTNGDFEFDSSNKLFLKGSDVSIPELLAVRILEFIDKKYPIEALVRFWKNCLLNPNFNAITQLYRFLEHNGHPITDNGYFLAYKRVEKKAKYDTKTGDLVSNIIGYDEDSGEPIYATLSDALTFTSVHKGPHGDKIKIGEPVSMPREECDSNPDRVCSQGLHVGSMAYVGDFSNADNPIIEVLVNPRNVVSVPIDYNNTKMRVCEYYPINICNGEKTTTFLESDYKQYDDKQLDKELEEYIKIASETTKYISNLEELKS